MSGPAKWCFPRTHLSGLPAVLPHHPSCHNASSLMFSCTRLDLLKPNIAGRVHDKQDAQRRHHDRHCQPRRVDVDQPVWVREGPQWVKGQVRAPCPISFSWRTGNAGETTLTICAPEGTTQLRREYGTPRRHSPQIWMRA